jgi:hypothetical protein
VRSVASNGWTGSSGAGCWTVRDQPIALDLPYKEGLRIHYFREVPDEKPIPVVESILYADEHLVVADKPHFLPVTPAGEYVEQTLLRRLIRRLDNPHLVPLHRIDRHRRAGDLLGQPTNPLGLSVAVSDPADR